MGVLRGVPLYISILLQLYFVGSASSFYFVYDFCLYGNMSSEVAYLLRFLPLCVAVLTCTLLLIARYITALLIHNTHCYYLIITLVY